MQKLNYLLICVLLSFSFLGYSQNFKNKNKKAAGQNPIHFNAVQISGKSGNKSALMGAPRNAFSIQTPDLNKAENENYKIVYDRNKPVYIEKNTENLKSAAIQNAEETFHDFFETVKEEVKISNTNLSFKIVDSNIDELGIVHLKSIQNYKGIPIYGSESALHISVGKLRFTGKVYNLNNDIDVKTSLSEAQATSAVFDDLKKITAVRQLTPRQSEILDYEKPEIKLVILETENMDYATAYEISIRPNFIEQWKYFIDARNGEIIRKYNNTPTDGPATATAKDLNGVLQTIDTYLENGKYIMLNAKEEMYNPEKKEGMIITLDANNTSTSKLDYSDIVSNDNTWNHPSGISAHYNATVAYRYFKNTFKRNSINGQGGNIISLVNVAADDGSSMANAFWNGKAAFYGNGGKMFKPLAGALDVAAHELGHGIVSTSANLEYYSQSGAINETFADIFGAMVDREDWNVGEDITLDGHPLRNMQDPANGKKDVMDGWQPKHMSDLVDGSILDKFGNRDNEGVHINSGIGNHAYYLYATEVSKEKAEQVFYRALTVYLTKTSKFIDFRIAVVQAANDLYGNGSGESLAAADVFDKVGIYEEQQTDYNQDYPENPGEEYLLCYNTDLTDFYTLYLTDQAASDFIPLSLTEMKGKVSVMDDGSNVVFVSTGNQLKVIDLNTAEEYTLSDDAFWENAAVSKDGKRIAGISTEIDTAIYVYDFESDRWAKFMLYNPTTSHDNTSAGGVLFADAIEFDHTGEYLMYDAYNVLNSNTDEDIFYWDIGFLKVWDYQSNDFGSGSIQKLYETLPEGVSIGNPVFSKNSPYIIAFDYYNEPSEEFGIFGANLNTGDVDLIYQNLIIGYPTYSKNDKSVAFTGLDDQNNEVVGLVPLAGNKIAASGAASLLINSAKWPVFFAFGQRQLGLKPVCNFTADIKIGSSPMKVKFMDLSINNPTSWSWTFEGGNPAESDQQNPVITYSNQGTFKVTLTAQNSFGSDTKTQTGYIQVTPATSTDEMVVNFISFYPNPAENMVHINSAENFVVKVFDLNGKQLISKNNQIKLDISELSPGIYILEINAQNELVREKLVKR